MRLHHVQVSCPPGGEDVARAVLRRGARPARGRQAAGARGPRRLLVPLATGVEVHVGVEEPFAPARKAHPAFVVAEDLDAVAGSLELPASRSTAEDAHFPGHRRFHTADGHGNRVELLAVWRCGRRPAGLGSSGRIVRRGGREGDAMSAPLSQTQMLLELEPVVEANLNRHLSMAKEWFPHEYVPWSEGRNFDGPLGGEPWTVERLRR